jgi:hypothetical protein
VWYAPLVLGVEVVAGSSESKVAAGCAVGEKEGLERSFLRKRAAVVFGLSSAAGKVCEGAGDDGGQVGPDLGEKLRGTVDCGRGGSFWTGGEGAAAAPRSLRTPFMEEQREGGDGP